MVALFSSLGFFEKEKALTEMLADGLRMRKLRKKGECACLTFVSCRTVQKNG